MIFYPSVDETFVAPFATVCDVSGDPITEPTSPLIFAHRGVSVEFPENTLEAFAAAASRGADGVELDVRRTADGMLVVHHDAELGDGRAIIAQSRAALPGSVPLLAEALEACEGLRVNIEIKNVPGEPDFDPACTVAADVVAMVHAMGMTPAVIVSSFTYDDIQRVRAEAADVATGWLVLGVGDVDWMLDRIVADGHRALHPPVAATDATVIAAAHARGVAVNTWTVDDPARIAELAADGVDGVITNDPATARAALSS